MPDVIVKAVETLEESAAVRSLRVGVFVDEQGGPMGEEFDEFDAPAVHAIASSSDGQIVGTGRVYRNAFGETQIGRMAVAAGARRNGIGGLILDWLEGQARSDGVDSVMVHAQAYVQSFYEDRGYAAEGDPFDEVGIEHIRMVKAF